MTINLSKEEYLSTFTAGMIDVTQTSEPVVDIWTYINELVTDKIVDQETYDNGHVAYVYLNPNNKFEHVLLPTNDKNIFIVIIIDLLGKTIKGHYRLDLYSEYNLT